MQVDTQEFLDLVEETGRLVFVDIEANGLKGDYNSTICVSFKPFGRDPYTLSIKQPGNDKRVVREAKDELERYSCWVTYYGRGFDIPFLNTRLLKWGYEPIGKKPHLDLYWAGKAHLLTGHRSQAHLLSWLGTVEQKMAVSASTWSELGFKFDDNLKILIERCESDVTGLEALYKRIRHVIVEIKK